MDRFKRLMGDSAQTNYQKLQGDDEEKISPALGDEKNQVSRRRESWTRFLTGFNVLFLVFNLFLLAKSSWPSKQSRNQVLRDYSYYSPIFDRLDIPYTTQRINASLANDEDSIWRMPPSPEVDAAWDRVSKLGYHAISAADVVALGKDPEMTVRAPLDWGFGPDAHIVQIDATHQIHCLNAVRQAMYPEYYPVRKLMADVHPQHCLHVILQNLMCDASVDVITYNWMETQHNPFPDMSINRQCRDFDALLSWHEENLVPLDHKIQKPEGVNELELTPKLRELLDAHKGESEDAVVDITGHHHHGSSSTEAEGQGR